MNINVLAGLTLEAFDGKKGDAEIVIVASGRKFKMLHYQDCCESVSVDSVSGNPQNAIGEVIIDATERNSRDHDLPNLPAKEWADSSETWTYYTIRTQSETMVIRWYGTSNGYYSESVDFEEVKVA